MRKEEYHFIKEKLQIKWYLRYMDDFVLIHPDRKYLERCREEISRFLAKSGFELHPGKTKVYPLKNGIKTLGFTHRLTETGKVIRLIDPDNVKAERRKLYRLAQKVKRGESTRAKADECYKAWKAHAAHGNCYKLIQRMDRYYQSLWR